MTIRGKFLGVAMGVWGVLVAGGFYGLLRHATQPGLAAAAGGSWPAQAAVEPAAGKLTVVMAVHPGCPCSEASMANLGEVLARHPGAAVCYVLFEPDKAISPEDCRKSALWKQASATKGMEAIVDVGHAATGAFGARTSGQVLVYDEKGELRFSGGVTAERDHYGESTGQDAVEALLAGEGNPACVKAPVFGCAL